MVSFHFRLNRPVNSFMNQGLIANGALFDTYRKTPWYLILDRDLNSGVKGGVRRNYLDGARP